MDKVRTAYPTGLEFGDEKRGEYPVALRFTNSRIHVRQIIDPLAESGWMIITILG